MKLSGDPGSRGARRTLRDGLSTPIDGGPAHFHRRGRRSEGTIIKIRSRLPGALIVAASVWVLCACSMSTSIQRDALDYNAGVANYNDQMF